MQSNGSVEVDKNSYYLKAELAGSHVGLKVVAASCEFEVIQAQQGLGRIKIKGLYNHQEMQLADYIELISAEARSLERRRQIK